MCIVSLFINIYLYIDIHFTSGILWCTNKKRQMLPGHERPALIPAVQASSHPLGAPPHCTLPPKASSEGHPALPPCSAGRKPPPTPPSLFQEGQFRALGSPPSQLPRSSGTLNPPTLPAGACLGIWPSVDLPAGPNGPQPPWFIHGGALFGSPPSSSLFFCLLP